MSQRKFERTARRRLEAQRRRAFVTGRRAGMAAGAVGAAVLFAPGAAHAASFQVNSLNDATADACTVAVDGCTLRDAITDANANAEADTITFAANVLGTITLDSDQLVVNAAEALTIQGPGAGALAISGDDKSRVLRAESGGALTISDLSLVNGNGTPTSAGADAVGNGGAISTNNLLTLVRSQITGSQAVDGGGLAASGLSSANLENTTVSGNQASGDGGGIHSRTSLSLTESTVSGNIASGGGGGIAHLPAGQAPDKYELTLTDSTISGNDAVRGGGLLIDASDEKYDTLISGTTISGNDAVDGNGGGIEFTNGRIDGQAQVINSTLAGNTAAGMGGGIHAGTFTPEPPDRSSQASPRGRDETGQLRVDNTTVAANDASGTGGGIALEDNAVDSGSVILHSTIVGDNTAGTANKDLATTSDGFDSTWSLVEVPGSAALTQDPAKPTITGQDPQLSALTDNGGPTQTKLPALSSPAIDKGDNDQALTIDQRRFSRTVDLAPANASDGTDVGSTEITSVPGTPPAPATPSQPVTPSATPSQCGRRAISLVRADVRGNRIRLTGLVGSKLFGKTVTIQTDPKGARSSAFTKTTTVRASSTGAFTTTVPKPAKGDFVSIRYRATSGGSVSPVLKLPQSLTSRSVKSAKNTITVKGQVKKSVLGKRNKVKIRRLVCGRYRTVGTAKPDANGNYSVTFGATTLRGVAFYRAESMVLRKPGSKVYVIQYARAIAIRTTGQTG